MLFNDVATGAALSLSWIIWGWVAVCLADFVQRTRVLVILLLLHQNTLLDRGVATFSALGGRAMIWGAYDSK